MRIRIEFCALLLSLTPIAALGQQSQMESLILTAIPSHAPDSEKFDNLERTTDSSSDTDDAIPSNAPIIEGQVASSPATPHGSADDKNWHIAVSPYLWFAGVHGTVGLGGRTASIHASGIDVLSHFNIGLMGAMEARKGRFVVPLDFMWIKLSDDKGIPVANTAGATSIKVKITQTILTPKAGYRILDGEKLKADALVGFRYWHLGQNFSLEPSGVGVYQSANWVDVVAGAKFQMAVSPKASITVLGDAGGGGANSEYQVAALLAYKIKPTVALEAGWRYLDVYYKGGSQFIYDVAQSGLLLGVTFNLK
jgi:hypothetical protein